MPEALRRTPAPLFAVCLIPRGLTAPARTLNVGNASPHAHIIAAPFRSSGPSASAPIAAEPT